MVKSSDVANCCWSLPSIFAINSSRCRSTWSWASKSVRRFWLRWASNALICFCPASFSSSVSAVVAALAPLERVGQVYLIGRLRARVPPAPPTITATGVEREVVTLTYASPSALRNWLATGVFDLDVTVQVRHIPGVVVPDVSITASDGELSTLLRGHLP